MARVVAKATMPTSVSCRRNPPASGSHSGFTLLEVLVVLVLIAGAIAIVAPRLEKTYAAIVSSGDRAESIRQIERLPAMVRATGQVLDLPAQSDTLQGLLDLPEGWRVQTLQPLLIEASGACHGSSISVHPPLSDDAETWRLGEPDCRVLDDVE